MYIHMDFALYSIEIKCQTRNKYHILRDKTLQVCEENKTKTQKKERKYRDTKN